MLADSPYQLSLLATYKDSCGNELKAESMKKMSFAKANMSGIETIELNKL